MNNFLKGQNGCIVAYGQKGSGKSFTMVGGKSLQEVLNQDNIGNFDENLQKNIVF